MSCFHPLKAWRTDDGDIVFADRGALARELVLPCGRCIGCRIKKSTAWAIRCVHESQMHPVNSFVTLTYDDSHVGLSLVYRDFQLFMKRLRKQNNGRVRFYMCGEYGEITKRPHFHALLFNVGFGRGQKCGTDLYRSAELEKLWPFGFSSYGNVTYESAGYVARYAHKKITGPPAKEHYERVHLATGEIVSVVPEFSHMSLKPGIGKPWFDKYWRDVYAARDGVVIKGKTLPVPSYYDDLLDRINPSLSSDKEYDRYINSKSFEADCTPERLLDREIVAKARANLNPRKI